MPTDVGGVSATPISQVLGQQPTATRVPKQELDKDAFLQLLVAQMKYQDPSSPMDTSAFLQQTTALTTVEKLTEMAETSRTSFDMSQRLAAASMIGKQVSWTGSDGVFHQGIVASASLSGGTPTLRVNDMDVALTQVATISGAPTSGA